MEFSRGVFYAVGEFSLETSDFRFCRIVGNFYDNPDMVETHHYHLPANWDQTINDVYKKSVKENS